MRTGNNPENAICRLHFEINRGLREAAGYSEALSGRYPLNICRPFAWCTRTKDYYFILQASLESAGKNGGRMMAYQVSACGLDCYTCRPLTLSRAGLAECM